ncbi:hypothetical protein [Paenibacillus glucanolyticus]|uniref:hypothetical protein n=1 Tax=Paenibacillus glucanolyticus TaxID=59843 RepID=UPI00128C1C9B|nr:hypothetical protein [Paenibacillus glucanolyticus]MPY19910.1 hypothetical protein [Paenibacillus glucanolyticus]
MSGNNQADKKLQELKEERRIKEVMARFAELEGRVFLKENQALSQIPFYQPSETSRKIFLQRIKYFT